MNYKKCFIGLALASALYSSCCFGESVSKTEYFQSNNQTYQRVYLQSENNSINYYILDKNKTKLINVNTAFPNGYIEKDGKKIKVYDKSNIGSNNFKLYDLALIDGVSSFIYESDINRGREWVKVRYPNRLIEFYFKNGAPKVKVYDEQNINFQELDCIIYNNRAFVL